MNYNKVIFTLFFGLSSLVAYSQKECIEFYPNGTYESQTKRNPFQKFIGEWTLKNDKWTQNWGNGTETITIENHHTNSQVINTANSLLSIIDGSEPNGHILWTFNPITKEVHHLSSFGTLRIGNGKGTINQAGDILLKLSFEGEPDGTYRIYNYKWINENEYHMKSIQYDKNNKLTGRFYEGNFIRVNSSYKFNYEKEIMDILKVLDNNELSIDDQLKVYSKDIVHMAPNKEAITDKLTLKRYLTEQRQYGTSHMKHQIVNIEVHGSQIIMRGSVEGTFYPIKEGQPIPFKTKNIFVFEREEENLVIKKIIYNMSPVD